MLKNRKRKKKKLSPANRLKRSDNNVNNENNNSTTSIIQNGDKDSNKQNLIRQRNPRTSMRAINNNYISITYRLLNFLISGILWIPLTIYVYIRQERLPRLIINNNNNSLLSWRETKFLQNSRGCTMDNCIDWSRCHNSTSFYVYKESDINSIENNIVNYLGKKEEIRKFNRFVIDTLKKSPELHIVDNPDEACFFVPRIACLSVGKCDIYEGFANLRLRNLKYWNNGYNHVLVDYSDDRFAVISGGAGSLEIHLRSGSSTQFFRNEFDVSLPLLPKSSLWKRVLREGKASKNRKTLLSFRGSLSDESRRVERIDSLARTSPNNVSEALRRQLKQLHNGNDIIIQVGHLNRKHLSDPGYWSSYNDLLLESKFQLVPRGLGLHSHRLLESIRAGSIPVLLSDGYVLPFDSIIPWEKAIIRIPEIEFQSIPDILKSISEERMHELQCNGLYIYHQFFMRPGGSMELAFRILKSRIINHDRYVGSEKNNKKDFHILRKWPTHSVPKFVTFCNAAIDHERYKYQFLYHKIL